MGMLDKVLANKDQVVAKASDLVHEHGAKIDDGLEKAGDSLSKATNGKYDHQIRKGVVAAKQGLAKLDEHGHPSIGTDDLGDADVQDRPDGEPRL